MEEGDTKKAQILKKCSKLWTPISLGTRHSLLARIASDNLTKQWYNTIMSCRHMTPAGFNQYSITFFFFFKAISLGVRYNFSPCQILNSGVSQGISISCCVVYHQNDFEQRQIGYHIELTPSYTVSNSCWFCLSHMWTSILWEVCSCKLHSASSTDYKQNLVADS